MNNQQIRDFFHGTEILINGNGNLREPQIGAYQEIRAHFKASDGPCYVQLPVGSGKTGLMGLTPFGTADGRVLIIAPNVTIRRTILEELNISDPTCFYIVRDVLKPTNGPFISELKTGANLHDCDEAHIVVANIQQFAGADNRWYEKFPHDYFRQILVDEGHHNVADTWLRLFRYFRHARVVSYTATPIRADGRAVLGKKVYSFPYSRSMILGYISAIDSVHVSPERVSFTAKGQRHELSLDEVLKMRDHDWFSKGIALSETCNRHIYPS